MLQKLTDIKGLSEAKIEKMIEAAKKLCPSHYGWQSAREVEHQVRRGCFHLSRPVLGRALTDIPCGQSRGLDILIRLAADALGHFQQVKSSHLS